MQTSQSVKRSKSFRKTLMLILVTFLSAVVISSCSSTGTCVGSGGNVLLSPVCKDGWTRSECGEWDNEGINDADWSYNGGKTCEGLGYTERCSDGSYRLPGGC